MAIQNKIYRSQKRERSYEQYLYTVLATLSDNGMSIGRMYLSQLTVSKKMGPHYSCCADSTPHSKFNVM